MGSAICGGVISESMQAKDIKKYGVWVNMMSFILPDKQYDKWVMLRKQNKDKEAKKLFDKYAMSQI